MANLRIVNILLGLSIVCVAVSGYFGLVLAFIFSTACVFLAAANRHYELQKLSRS